MDAVLQDRKPQRELIGRRAVPCNSGARLRQSQRLTTWLR